MSSKTRRSATRSWMPLCMGIAATAIVLALLFFLIARHRAGARQAEASIHDSKVKSAGSVLETPRIEPANQIVWPLSPISSTGEDGRPSVAAVAETQGRVLHDADTLFANKMRSGQDGEAISDRQSPATPIPSPPRREVSHDFESERDPSFNLGSAIAAGKAVIVAYDPNVFLAIRHNHKLLMDGGAGVDCGTKRARALGRGWLMETNATFIVEIADQMATIKDLLFPKPLYMNQGDEEYQECFRTASRGLTFNCPDCISGSLTFPYLVQRFYRIDGGE